jgi:hypothetical protein
MSLIRFFLHINIADSHMHFSNCARYFQVAMASFSVTIAAMTAFHMIFRQKKSCLSPARSSFSLRNKKKVRQSEVWHVGWIFAVRRASGFVCCGRPSLGNRGSVTDVFAL